MAIYTISAGCKKRSLWAIGRVDPNLITDFLLEAVTNLDALVAIIL
jgi:hypothetical protein